MNPLQNFTRKFPWLMGILMVVYIWCIILYIPILPGYFGLAISQCIYAAIAAVIAILFVSPAAFHRTTTGIGWAFRNAKYYIFINIILIGLLLTAAMIGSVAASDSVGGTDVFKSFIFYVVDCIGVGILEETAFRIFLFGGLLAVWGKTQKGVLGAAVVSSLIFGVMHVVGALFSDELTATMLIQCLEKTIQSGTVGFLMCALYYKTHNIWGPVIIHGLGDFVLFFPAGVMGADSTNFAGGSNVQMYSYLLIIVLNIPVLLSAIKMLKSEPMPQLGNLMDDSFLPRVPADMKKAKKKEQP